MSTTPRRMGKYNLIERLAQGGQGEVWRARDPQLERDVAIKILRADLQHDPEFEERFRREAQLVAGLRHPNIVQLHDFRIAEPPEVETPTAYMVMDYVPGQTLSGYIRSTSRKGQFPSAGDLVHLFSVVSLGLDYAHGKGMVHRDIKPANILLDHRQRTVNPMGEPVLTDFGIARMQGLATGTVVGSLLGTPIYISPEQAQGKHGDRRSDLYSLGVILYEITTGVTPFRGESTVAILMQHIHDMPTSPMLINPHISPALSSVILKSLAKKPEERFDTAVQMAIALTEALNVQVPQRLLSGTRGISMNGLSMPLASTSLTPPGPAITPNYSVYGSPASGATPAGQMSAQLATQTPRGPYTQAHSQPTAMPIPPTPAPVPPEREEQKRKKGPLIALILALIVVLIGAGVGVFMLLPRPETPTKPTSAITGHIQFSRSSPQAAPGYDQIDFEVENVPPPPAGYDYYAWIDSPNSEGNKPQWKLTYANGSLRATHFTFNGKNLLVANTTFVITIERANPPPFVPNTDPQSHIGYVELTPSTTSYEINPCPSNGKSRVC